MEESLFNEYFLIRLLINTVSMFIMIRIIYYLTHQTRELFFTFFMLNFVIFLLTFMIEKAKAFSSFGTAFGLLAAFSLLRFRTETITTRDMTYLFIIMAVGLINSIMKGTYLEIIGTNGMIIIIVYLADSNLLMREQKSKMVEYDSLEHIKPAQRPQLIAILKERTGLDIHKISIEEFDFKRNLVMIKIYYY